MADPELLTLPELAVKLDVDVTKARQLIRDGAVLAVRGEDGVLRVPAAFLQDGRPVKGLPGVITLLRDNGYSDDEALSWLFADDASLPGTPIEALAANRGTEVKRRAQALGW
ncbi:MAG TPA: Rv2175c family DNA-binding protein [Jatrophihabitans sp.]|nr:Rv2175c family DNA-binding protein [Jatrophihabitans sp.]